MRLESTAALDALSKTWQGAGVGISRRRTAASFWRQEPIALSGQGFCTAAGPKAVGATQLGRRWADVPSLPGGAKIAVIEGPMNQAVPFTARLRLPANYRIPPHRHPAVEHLTILSGTFNMGMGEAFDQAKTTALTTGSVAVMEVGVPHFAWTQEETLLQLHGVGPWGIEYINPADDPRRK